MRNLLALGGAALVIFLGLGWYLDWYRLKSSTGDDGKQHISIDVNANKVTEDVGKGKDWLSKDHTPQTVISIPVPPPLPASQTSFRPGSDVAPIPPPLPKFDPAPPGPVLPPPQ